MAGVSRGREGRGKKGRRGPYRGARRPKSEFSGELGRRIRSLRIRADMTMKELAEESGVTQPSLSRYELGQFVPTVDVLDRIARALGVTVGKLTKGMKDDK